MIEYRLFADFTSLSRKNAGDWVANCSSLADEVFRNSSNQTRLLGNLLVLEQYFHTLKQGLKERGEEPGEITYQALDMLWDYLYGKIKPVDFEDFANKVYACVLDYMVGEELTEGQAAFYKNHFADDNIKSLNWEILAWASYLLLELTAIHGGQLDFDEFEGCDFVDFIQIDEMLNVLNDVCIEFAGVECPSSKAKDVIKAMEDVYETPLFQSIVLKIQKGLKDALHARPEAYERLREEYSQYGILPEEFAADFLDD
ncbi:hypothetical protein [Anaerotignum sp.]|uniref:hypothetical protein n=1 Tax=Anaerotignum sp. TaxID=2039241 RepID=UPI002A908D9A|nr:hypothetical protein [Anaerotignum sp.]MCI7657666.1 hypothetical protein [Clostridia bacterium]MDY5415445.1 hypothetical protein [Anaerotignum sp.]